MKKRNIYFIILLLSTISVSLQAQLALDLEGGYIFSIPYNKVRIPAAGGTQFDLAKDLTTQNTFTFRVRLNYTINERHIISALYAPLTIKSSGQIDEAINYSEEIFPANAQLNAEYKFNSYRLTYRYLIVNNDHVRFGLGITGKIRDANITLRSNNNSADYPDLGFVPLVNFYFSFQPIEKLGVVIEGDALGTKQGRAEDIFAGVTYNFSKSITGKAGYRILEGGADVERNYNFSWINYAVAGVILKPLK
jgi:hypothetical protein